MLSIEQKFFRQLLVGRYCRIEVTVGIDFVNYWTKHAMNAIDNPKIACCYCNSNLIVAAGSCMKHSSATSALINTLIALNAFFSISSC